MAKYKIARTQAFRKDLKAAKKRRRDLDLLSQVVNTLAEGDPLPERCRDHALSGSFTGFRECHIQPDWLLIYKIGEDRMILCLMRTGSHSDLF